MNWGEDENKKRDEEEEKKKGEKNKEIVPRSRGKKASQRGSLFILQSRFLC